MKKSSEEKRVTLPRFNKKQLEILRKKFTTLKTDGSVMARIDSMTDVVCTIEKMADAVSNEPDTTEKPITRVGK